jgi:hypothetical protein
MEQAVIFQVADNRRIQHVITIIVEIDLRLEFFITGKEFVCHGAL